MQDLGFDTTQILIGGRWHACSGGRTLALSNPSDGSELARIARGEAADLDELAKRVVMPIQSVEGVTRTLTCPVIQL